MLLETYLCSNPAEIEHAPMLKHSEAGSHLNALQKMGHITVKKMAKISNDPSEKWKILCQSFRKIRAFAAAAQKNGKFFN